MKKFAKLSLIIALIAIICAACVGFTACNDKDGGELRFAAPQGTPALAILKLCTDNKTIDGKTINYEVVNPNNIAVEMSSKKADLVIMPVNAGANIIRQGTEYKLVSIAVEGSLFIVGKKTGSSEITFDDLKGKRIACIGQTGVPGLVFRYVMKNNGVELITSGTPNENQALVNYVAAAPNAKQLFAANEIDFAAVGEPAATQFKSLLSLNAEMDLQAAYKNVNAANGETYPQAGLFVKKELYNNEKFMNELFAALDASKQWVNANPAEVTAFAKQNLYESAAFPAPCIPRCDLNCAKLSSSDKDRVIAFLKNLMPKDSEGNAIDWEAAAEKIF